MDSFWSNFWSNFLANIAVVFVLSFFGYLAKNQIVKNLKVFIGNEVVDTLFTIEKAKKKKTEEKNI